VASTLLEGRISDNWERFQRQLGEAVRPLSREQLRFRPGADQRSLGELMRHIVAVRADWFCFDLREEAAPLATLARWQDEGQPERGGDELADGMALSWDYMQRAMARWTPAQWGERLTNANNEVNECAWVVWHVLEHDLHHGGQALLLCALQDLPYPAL
jgi:uncharacterized damage-inducible protein DinB